MKRLILLFFCVSSFAYSQQVVKDEIDEFTGSHVKETSWEVLANRIPHTYVRFRVINDINVIDFKFMIGSVFAVRKGENIMLKLDNNEILKFNVIEHTISGRGDGAVKLYGSEAQGMYISCVLSDENIEKIKSNIITKIRVNTTDGYVECEIKEKKYKKVKSLIELI